MTPSDFDGKDCRCSESPPARLRRGIEQFNHGQFYEQHETLEEEWLAERDPVRYLYQGILQIGVGFEHLRRATPAGARALWQRGISYLEPFRGGCMNVDVDRLVAATERCIDELERVGIERFDRVSGVRVPPPASRKASRLGLVLRRCCGARPRRCKAWSGAMRHPRGERGSGASRR